MPSVLREMNSEAKPREKFLARGAQALTTAELVAILLRTGYQGHSVLAVAEEVLEAFHVVDPEAGIAYGGQLGMATVPRLCKIKGIGPDKAVTLCAAIELGRRLSEMKAKQTYADFSMPEAVANYSMDRLRNACEEHFLAAFLDTKNRLIRMEVLSTGGLVSSLAEQRKVFRKAIEANAASLILLHNHPSGDPTPSADDIRVTKIFVEAGKLMGIPILDHVIIGDGTYVSLCEKGYL